MKCYITIIHGLVNSRVLSSSLLMANIFKLHMMLAIIFYVHVITYVT